MLMPGKKEQVVGGHAIAVIGYDFDFYNNPVFKKSGLSRAQVSNEMFEIRNSWGAAWGDKGNFWMPVAYLCNKNLADDAWSLVS